MYLSLNFGFFSRHVATVLMETPSSIFLSRSNLRNHLTIAVRKILRHIFHLETKDGAYRTFIMPRTLTKSDRRTVSARDPAKIEFSSCFSLRSIFFYFRFAHHPPGVRAPPVYSKHPSDSRLPVVSGILIFYLS